MGEDESKREPVGFPAHCVVSALLVIAGVACLLFFAFIRAFSPGFYPLPDFICLAVLSGALALLIAWGVTRNAFHARFLKLDLITYPAVGLVVFSLATLLGGERLVGCDGQVHRSMTRADGIVSFDRSLFVYDSQAWALFASGHTLHIRPGQRDVICSAPSLGIAQVGDSLYSVSPIWDEGLCLSVHTGEEGGWDGGWRHVLDLDKDFCVKHVFAHETLIAVEGEKGAVVVDTADMSQTWLPAEGPQPDWLVRAREAWTGPPTEAVVGDELWRLEDGAILICDLDGNPRERLIPKNFSIRHLVAALVRPSNRGDPWEHVYLSAE